VSDKTGPLAFVARLRERAKRGDKLAMAELQKLKAIGTQYKQLAMQTAAANAAEEVEGDEEGDDEVLGDDEGEHFAGDKLEAADWISRKHDNADGLVQKVKLREHGWRGLSDVAKFTRINPPSVMQGTLGGYQVVRSDAVSPIQVANWGGEDEETIPITVTFAPVEQILLAVLGSAGAAPYGVIQWGTRASLAKAVVDIGKGMQLTINASYCTLQVGVDSVDNTGVITNNPVSMKLMGMLSFYPCVRTAPVTRTVYLSFAGGTSAAVDVPAFAKNVIVLPLQSGAPPVAADYEILFLNSAGNTMYTRTVRDATTGPMVTPYPLSDAITAIKIAVTGAFFSHLVFELAI
jgi:hypothetical protein